MTRGPEWPVGPSPKPVSILEQDVITDLLNKGNIVITCGGGGIPVVEVGKDDYEGVDAVIDKDFAAAKLAELINADALLILTAVSKVCIGYSIRTIDSKIISQICNSTMMLRLPP